MFKQYNNLKNLRPVEIMVAVLVCLFLLAVIPVACRKSRADACRLTCAQNLSVIGKAMMSYANDYKGKLPLSGGSSSYYTPRIFSWNGENRSEAFNLKSDGSGGRASISSCFYLLVKHGGVPPKSFICPGDFGTTEFKVNDANAVNRELTELWDFGPFPFEHCSYSYHMPFSFYPLTMTSQPGMAVAADRNPWIRSPAAKPKQFPANFAPDAGREAVKAGNSISHQEEGQNVLFLDNHVNFEKRSFCGINDDNIYTYWHDGDIRMGYPPMPGEPADKTDSLLIHDQPSGGEPRPTRGPKGEY
jgi:hypothetical protein